MNSTKNRPVLRLIDCAANRVEEENRETVGILSALLSRATLRAVKGLTLCFMDGQGKEHMVFTGPYKENKALAVNAAAKITWRLTLAQEQEQQERDD
jgi:hypothetical protein